MYHIFCKQTLGILCKEQHGFQTGKSCDSLTRYCKWFCKLSEWRQTNRCYIFFIFIKHSIKYPTRDCLTNYLIMELEALCWHGYKTTLPSNRLKNVILEGICSSNSLVISGVPQGTVLAPCYFCALWMIFRPLYNAKSDYMLMISYCTQR